MEVWIDEKRPDVMSTANIALALVVHVVCFLGFLLFAKLHFRPKETVIPIELSVVVNENLDGSEDEPPPLDDPPPMPPEPPKDVAPPPPRAEPKADAVVKVADKPKKPEKKPPEKKPEARKEEPKKPEPPKKEEPKKPEKTKEELRRERLEKIRSSATPVAIKVPDRPSGNGKTSKQTMTEAQIRDMLNKGVPPGAKTVLADSELQFCLSRVQQAIDARWKTVNPPIGAEGTVNITVRFDASGAMVGCRVSGSCGDRTSDAAALTVVRTVGPIAGLTRGFIGKYMKEDLVVRYRVARR